MIRNWITRIVNEQITNAMKEDGEIPRKVAKYVDHIRIAEDISPSEIAEHFDGYEIAREIDIDDIVYNIDMSDVASYIDTSDMADHFSAEDIAQHMDIEHDWAEVARNMMEDLEPKHYAELLRVMTNSSPLVVQKMHDMATMFADVLKVLLAVEVIMGGEEE